MKRNNNALVSSSKIGSFNIYYLNFLKTYEISMMIDNEVISLKTKEKVQEINNTKTSSVDGKINYLTQASASMNQSKTSSENNVSKIIETFEVKTTKSRLLDKIISKCTKTENFDNVDEGQLVKIDAIQLKILNEENLRQIIVIKGNTLKGLNIEGLELNNIISSMLQDYAYLLYAKTASGEKIIVKIPLDIHSEFENKYSINDLLIGKVSIIGIYKNIVTEEMINLNTFNYLTEIGLKNESRDKVIKSSSCEMFADKTQNQIKEKYYYIDLIAIIQDIYYEQPINHPKKEHWLVKLYRQVIKK